MKISKHKVRQWSDVNEQWINGLSKVINEHGCWIFQGCGSVNNRGKRYGIINIFGRPRRLNRLVAYVYHGLNLKDELLQAMHTCDETMCFNPEHIKIGTPYDNAMDAVGKMHHPQSLVTTCPRGHELDGRYKNGNRYCKTCGNAATRRYREALK